MSNNVMSDIVDYLERIGIGKRNVDLFTRADQGAYENRPLSIVVTSATSARSPEITEPVDYIAPKISVAGVYGQEGEDRVGNKADEVYRALLLILDEVINGTLYISIRSTSAPAFVGFDEHKRTVIEFDIEVMRYRGDTNGN